MSDKVQEALLTVENLFIEQDKAHHTEIASLKEDISGMQLVQGKRSTITKLRIVWTHQSGGAYRGVACRGVDSREAT